MVKVRDAINRRLYNNQSFVLTAIYHVFSDLEFSSKNLNRTVLGLPQSYCINATQQK
ncbi:MAG: hypothetical protein V7K26_26600 [Nostoc sp.]